MTKKGLMGPHTPNPALNLGAAEGTGQEPRGKIENSLGPESRRRVDLLPFFPKSPGKSPGKFRLGHPQGQDLDRMLRQLVGGRLAVRSSMSARFAPFYHHLLSVKRVLAPLFAPGECS
jgi:hypothetical protein